MRLKLKIPPKAQGICYIIMAAFGFSCMSLFVKLAGQLPPFQKAFFRNFIALIFMFAVLLRQKVGFRPNKGSFPGLIGRSFFGTVGLLCNFYAIGQLNLSDANMLNKLSPFFSILFSALLLKEKPNLVQIGGVLAAFLGSVFIIKPGFQNAALLPALAGVVGGMGAGIAYTFVRALGQKGEDSRRIVFYFSAFSCLLCLPFFILQFQAMSLWQTASLLLAGLFACIGQMGLTLRPG